MSEKSISQRPYLLRAMHEWITDSGQTPHLVVNAMVEGVDVPNQHIQDGKIILNASYAAVQNLELGNEMIFFEARFGGAPHLVRVPVIAVLGIYARETSRGMVFSDADDAESNAGVIADGGNDAESNAALTQSSSDRADRSHLRVIK